MDDRWYYGTGCNAHTETTNNLPEGCEAQVWSFK
jgi:hypothetical protein